MSKPKYHVRPDLKTAQRVQQSIARSIVKATLRRTPHAEVIDDAPMAQVVLHQGSQAPASFWTADREAAERLCKLIGDLRRLAVSYRFDEGIEAAQLTIGGLSRKGKLSPINHAIKRLAQKLQTREPALILAEIERDCAGESDVLEDLRAAADDPVQVEFQEVTGERVNYRRTDTGEERTVKPKTIQNCLSKKV